MKDSYPINSLGYVRIGMRDPQDWAQLGESILGFRAETCADGSVQLRMDCAPARFIVERAAEDGFICCGWQASQEGFEKLVANLSEVGVSLSEGSRQDCAARSVEGFVRGKDTSGNLFEIFHGMESADSAFESPIEGVAFVADQIGMGHAVLPAGEFDATCEFYQGVLGFQTSDELTLPPPVEGAPEMRVNFYHGGSPRHHSLGFFNGPAPSGVVHIMVEMTTLDAVGACLDRVNAAGHPLTATLGRHVNDGMVSFYFLAPGGIPLEVGWDGRQFDWHDFAPTKSTLGDVWGHEYKFPG